MRATLGRTLALAVTATMLACDPAPFVPGEAVPEPAQALRPVERAPAPPQEAHIVDYRIEAKLDAETHAIDGKLRMTWRNRTRRRVKSLPFHLYMNAFRAEDTAWMREARGSHRGETLEDGEWGWIDVSGVRLLERTAVEEVVGLAELAPESAAELNFAENADPTTMHVELPAALGPGEAVSLEMDFHTQLPPVFARTGYHEDFHMVGQWFPKIGVLEEAAGWRAHTFTLNGEFYADFGDYEVELDVPAEMVVGATGIRVGEKVEGGRKRLSYRAEMVHDFAWVADPNFVEHWGEYEGIRIRQLIFPAFGFSADAHMQAQQAALASMERRFGPYPWSTITIVHVPEGAEGAGGMEYPTLYTTSDVYTPSLPLPPSWFSERVSGVFTSVHEFGHQYFQGMFASNEQAQPWLDEGMNTMSNMLVYLDAYGDPEAPGGADPWIVRILGHELRVSDMASLSLLDSLYDPVDQDASEFRALIPSYGAMVYQKTAALMLTLRNLVGHERFDAAMSTYTERARFRHPRGAWLEDVLVESLGARAPVTSSDSVSRGRAVMLDVRDYLDQALREVSEVDFRILKVTHRPVVGESGWHRDNAGKLVVTDAPDRPKRESAWDDAELEATVVVQRRGDFRVPVELMVEFTDGTRETVTWDGRARTQIFTWPGRRVRFATLDPHRKLWLEGRRLDNTRAADDIADVPSGRGLESQLANVEEALALAAMGVIGP